MSGCIHVVHDNATVWTPQFKLELNM